jgi:hypothetical protein
MLGYVITLEKICFWLSVVYMRVECKDIDRNIYVCRMQVKYAYITLVWKHQMLRTFGRRGTHRRITVNSVARVFTEQIS